MAPILQPAVEGCQGMELFLFDEFDLVQALPILSGEIGLAGNGIEGDAVEHVGTVVTEGGRK